MSLDGVAGLEPVTGLDTITSTIPASVSNFNIASIAPLLPLLDPNVVDPSLLAEIAQLVPLVRGRPLVLFGLQALGGPLACAPCRWCGGAGFYSFLPLSGRWEGARLLWGRGAALCCCLARGAEGGFLFGHGALGTAPCKTEPPWHQPTKQ
jgi:hypothetical protein